MGNAKRLLQRRLDQWKNAATQFIAGPEEVEEEPSLELDPELLAKCRQMADAQQVTVSEIVNQIVEQYWTLKSNELLVPISREQLARNPLLYLDGLSERSINLYGDTQYEQH
ncbi:hypothetical protein [Paenibacillus sp. 32352]|uniref:hypothetical protein n=1 Tax=Paenibacillus sp. 32352 TaxID=1969111 RepID=UPI0009AE8C49|nr:hypothetical protein [Paenibacillus sp. 32352]